MSYLRAFIDACPAYGWQGGPEFNTRIVPLMNGRERRNGNWSQPKHRFSLPFQNIGRESYRNILQMFMVCQGMLNTFLYRDPLNHAAANQLFDTGDGVQTDFQLSALFLVDGVPFLRQVTSLYVPDNNGTAVQSSVTVTVNNTPTAVDVDYDRGLVRFSVAPSNGALLRWSGEFSIWVRFNQDALPFSLDARNANDEFVNGSVDLTEEPPPEQDGGSWGA